MNKWDYSGLDIISDIGSIPEPDGSFDAILCTEVFEHIINPVEAVQEFSRLLVPGGHLIITAPFCSLTHFAPYHFYSGFSRYFYETCLKNFGFEIIELKSNGNYFEYLAQEMHRLESVSARYSKFAIKKKGRKSIAAILKLLESMSRDEKDSSELLCYGWHIYARKLMPGVKK